MTGYRRRRHGGARLLLLLLTFVVEYWVIADENHGVIADDVNGANMDDQGEDKQGDDNTTRSKDTFRTENGLFVFTQVADIPAALPPELGDFVLLLMAVYSPTCPHSSSLITNLETAAQHISQLSSLESTPPPIVFAKLDGTLVEDAVVSLKEQLGVVSYPTLVFVRGNFNDAIVMDYIGPQDTWEDIYETALHYWYRYAHHPSTTSVISLENVTELDRWVQMHGPLAVRHLLPALNPNLSEEERTHIQWLMDEDENDKEQEPFVFFVKCNNKEDERYLQLSETMAARRNVLFFALHNCTGLFPTNTTDNNNDDDDDDMVYLSMLVSPPPSSSSRTDWKRWKDDCQQTWLHLPAAATKSALEPFVVKMTTPSVLWFDRKSVAPIAFPTYRKIHAVLFVDTHNNGSFQKMAIQQFRQSCRLQKSKQDDDNDMVCLIVPQTERRILITFGIDPWTPLDVQATTTTDGGPIQPVLPTLLITDQRYGGTRRFYLDATDMMASSTSTSTSAGAGVVAIQDFIRKFWNNDLTPVLQSSSRVAASSPPRTNKSGVKILTAASFHETILMPTKTTTTTEKHALVYFFAPTCGHCKRFSILWNELAQLVRHLKWDTVLDIVKMDVTTNEILFPELTLDIELVPAVYYFGTDKTRPIRYDIEDEFGDTAGRLSDPLDIVEWLLDVSDLDHANLLQLLQDANEPQETAV